MVVINRALFTVLMGAVGLIWFYSPTVGYVIALTMVINLVTAGLAGAGLPVVLECLAVDPALASGAFVTIVTDVVGFFAFLGFAEWILF